MIAWNFSTEKPHEYERFTLKEKVGWRLFQAFVTGLNGVANLSAAGSHYFIEGLISGLDLVQKGLTRVNPDREFTKIEPSNLVRVYYEKRGILPIQAPVYVYQFGGSLFSPIRVEYLTEVGVVGIVLQKEFKKTVDGMSFCEAKVLVGKELYSIRDFDWYYGTRVVQVKKTKTGSKTTS